VILIHWCDAQILSGYKCSFFSATFTVFWELVLDLRRECVNSSCRHGIVSFFSAFLQSEHVERV
jgi:hypothetical protein